jgi:transposase
MPSVNEPTASYHATEEPGILFQAAGKLHELRIDDLRQAIRENQVSFPSQVPAFARHDRPDVQQKVVQLYFVLGWSSDHIGPRYGLSRARVQQILNAWMWRAVELGYVQFVPLAEMVFPSGEQAPIHVVLSQVRNAGAAPIVQRPVRLRSGSRRLTVNHSSRRKGVQKGPRPRRRFELRQISRVLRQLRAGRSVAEIAGEIGSSLGTIYRWREQQEIGNARVTRAARQRRRNADDGVR